MLIYAAKETPPRTKKALHVRTSNGTLLNHQWNSETHQVSEGTVQVHLRLGQLVTHEADALLRVLQLGELVPQTAQVRGT